MSPLLVSWTTGVPASEPVAAMLPLWLQWAIGIATFVFGFATVALAIVAARLAAQSKLVAAQTKDIAEQSKFVAEQTKATSEWQRHNQEIANFKRRLEQRVGHAYSVFGREALGRVIQQFPRSPGEFPDDRAARQQQKPDGDAASDEDFESLMFTRQSEMTWTLEMWWGSYASIEEAYEHAATQYQLPLLVPPADAAGIWAVSATHLLVTRRAGAGTPG